jgi:hypothetical protein
MGFLRREFFFQITNTISFMAVVLINGLANTNILGGKTTGEISDLYPTLLTPAGYVFSIWGIIYALLLGFIVYQASPRNRDRPFLKQINYLFILSNVANIVWLFLWQYGQITLSPIMMFVLLSTLVAIYLRLQIGKLKVVSKERWLVHLPFSVYLGWITVATIANISAALVSTGWNGFGLSTTLWAALVIFVALLITGAVLFTRGDIAYSLVIIWALAGIIVKQNSNQTVVMTAAISMATIAIIMVVKILFLRHK